MFFAQALVEQFSAAGKPEAVERCVLHMDVASLDFSQVGLQEICIVSMY